MQNEDRNTYALDLPSTAEDQDSRQRRQERPPVLPFDPYFGSPNSASEHIRDFDEMMWERA